MFLMYILGIDPGPVVGLVRIELDAWPPPVPAHIARLVSVEALQVTRGLLENVLEVLAANRPAVAVERFVVGPRAARSRTPAAGAAAREVVALVQSWTETEYLKFIERSAAEVKPWAMDGRLNAARLLAPTTGMRHARDAARHALFAAVKDFGLPDPLSTRAGV